MNSTPTKNSTNHEKMWVNSCSFLRAEFNGVWNNWIGRQIVLESHWKVLVFKSLELLFSLTTSHRCLRTKQRLKRLDNYSSPRNCNYRISRIVNFEPRDQHKNRVLSLTGIQIKDIRYLTQVNLDL